MNINEHGGGCCGIRHVFGFDRATAADLENYVAHVDAMTGVSDTRNRLIEVVLSERQMNGDRAPEGGWPNALQRLGFVLVNRFDNANSRNNCYVFHRNGVANPLPVEHANWNGPVGPQRVALAAPATAETAEEWRTGDRIRYTLEGAMLFGRTATITAVRPNGHDDRRYDLRFDNGQIRQRYTSRYFERVETPEPATAPRVLYTTFHNVLRAGRGAGFATLEQAQNAAPRAASVDKLEVMSDGELRWTVDVFRRR